MTRTITVDHVLKAPPSKVWRTLTEPALLARWLMDNDIAPVVGHRFSFRSKPGFTDANDMAFHGMSKGWQQMGDRIDAIWV